MNRAMPSESGTAMISASTAAQTVPNATGITYDQKGGKPVGSSEPFAPKAGRLWMIRNTATAASVTRISSPAPSAAPENTLSPSRLGGLPTLTALMGSVLVLQAKAGWTRGPRDANRAGRFPVRPGYGLPYLTV